MKTLKLPVYLVLFTLLISLFSCSEDDPPPPQNYFNLDGTQYTVAKGYIQPWGENSNGSYDFDIWLVSSGINYSTSSGEFFGIGELVYIDLNTSSANGLVNGTYNYSSYRDAFTFTDGIIGIQIDAANQTGDEVVEIVGGSIVVKVTGNDVTLDFDLTTSKNTNVKGNFTGSLTFM